MRGFRRWQDGVSLALAMWICVSPAVFPFACGGKVVAAAGIALGLIALVALEHPLSLAPEIIRLLMAAFTFFTPRIFGFGGEAASNLRLASLALLALTAASVVEIQWCRTYYRRHEEAVHGRERTS